MHIEAVRIKSVRENIKRQIIRLFRTLFTYNKEKDNIYLKIHIILDNLFILNRRQSFITFQVVYEYWIIHNKIQLI